MKATLLHSNELFLHQREAQALAACIGDELEIAIDGATYRRKVVSVEACPNDGTAYTLHEVITIPGPHAACDVVLASRRPPRPPTPPDSEHRFSILRPEIHERLKGPR